MISTGITRSEVQQFIIAHENSDPFELSLRHKAIGGIPIQEIANQIAARKKAKKKLPEWYTKEGIIYPPLLSMEQCSSTQTATYKSTIVQGDSIMDLTGGAGVDSYYFSKQFKQVLYVEQGDQLCKLSSHNFNKLDALNIEVINEKAEEFVKSDKKTADIIYIDPARRDLNKRKVHSFHDCSPDVVSLLPDLKRIGNSVLIKASPLLDITQSIKELGGVKEVHIVSINNDCKELLYLLGPQVDDNPKIVTINITNTHEEKYQFNLSTEASSEPTFSKPLTFLYEPNVSILKAGAFKSISSFYGVDKLHPNTHLYTSEKLVEGFPGRVFQIEAVCAYRKKDVSSILKTNKANIAARNFPEDVKTIRKKLALKDGGDNYIFAATTMDNDKVILITKKVS